MLGSGGRSMKRAQLTWQRGLSLQRGRVCEVHGRVWQRRELWRCGEEKGGRRRRGSFKYQSKYNTRARGAVGGWRLMFLLNGSEVRKFLLCCEKVGGSRAEEGPFIPTRWRGETIFPRESQSQYSASLTTIHSRYVLFVYL